MKSSKNVHRQTDRVQPSGTTDNKKVTVVAFLHSSVRVTWSDGFRRGQSFYKIDYLSDNNIDLFKIKSF